MRHRKPYHVPWARRSAFWRFQRGRTVEVGAVISAHESFIAKQPEIIAAMLRERIQREIAAWGPARISYRSMEQAPDLMRGHIAAAMRAAVRRL